MENVINTLHLSGKVIGTPTLGHEAFGEKFYYLTLGVPRLSGAQDHLPVTLSERLLDGGMTDSIPLEFSEKAGFDKNIVVLTQPRSYVKKKNKLFPAIKLFLHKYKGLVKAMSVRHEMYNSQKEYVFTREKEGLAFVIAPEMSLPAGRIEHDKDKLQQAYDIGRSTALSSLDALRSFIEK